VISQPLQTNSSSGAERTQSWATSQETGGKFAETRRFRAACHWSRNERKEKPAINAINESANLFKDFWRFQARRILGRLTGFRPLPGNRAILADCSAPLAGIKDPPAPDDGTDGSHLAPAGVRARR
jgi:hypothetical protein